jgi:hypothetical protein
MRYGKCALAAGGGAIALSVSLVGGIAAIDASDAYRAEPDRARAAKRCPEDALPLPSNGIAVATDAALAQVRDAYSGIDTSRAQANIASRAAADAARGPQVKRQCGERVAARTTIVYLFFPEMRPSASLTQGVVFVSRFSGGYRIWQVAH